MITDAQLDEFLPMAQVAVDASYDQFSPKPRNIDGPFLSIEKGKRYARIVASDSHTNGTSRSVWGFVDMTNGDLLKANSWKSPAKNFARGNILADDRGLDGKSWTGVS